DQVEVAGFGFLAAKDRIGNRAHIAAAQGVSREVVEADGVPGGLPIEQHLRAWLGERHMHDLPTADDEAAVGVQGHAADAAPFRESKGDLALAAEQVDAATQHVAEIETLAPVHYWPLDEAITRRELLHVSLPWRVGDDRPWQAQVLAQGRAPVVPVEQPAALQLGNHEADEVFIAAGHAGRPDHETVAGGRFEPLLERVGHLLGATYPRRRQLAAPGDGDEVAGRWHPAAGKSGEHTITARLGSAEARKLGFGEGLVERL